MTKITILDGGMGRELHRRGAPFQQPEWSALALMQSPETVAAVHADFIRAGAQIITTNSYAIVPFHIGAARFAEQGFQLAELSAKLAQQAVQETGNVAQIAASFPPLFGSYHPDLFDENAAHALAEPLLRGLLPYADIALAETISSIQEAAFWHEKLRHSGKPIWLSFTLDDTQHHENATLRSGESVFQAAQNAQNWGVDAILFNCSQPEIMANAIATTKAIFQQNQNLKQPKIGVYANAFVPPQGEMQAANDGLDAIRPDNSPENYLAWAKIWVEQGAEIVGGCCGIAPEHIRELARYFQAA